jgi:hypothetical protein
LPVVLLKLIQELIVDTFLTQKSSPSSAILPPPPSRISILIWLRFVRLFDATNFFTFLDSFNQRAPASASRAQQGGRDNLRLLGLALLVTFDGQVPLFHLT